MSSILPCPPCLPPVMLSVGGGGLVAGGLGKGRGVGRRGLGRGLGRRGQGIFHPPCHMLHYHMVLRLKGTSQIRTQENCFRSHTISSLLSPSSPEDSSGYLDRFEGVTPELSSSNMYEPSVSTSYLGENENPTNATWSTRSNWTLRAVAIDRIKITKSVCKIR